MALADSLAILNVVGHVASGALERDLLQVEIVAAFSGRALRKFVPVVIASLVCLVWLVDCEALLSVFLVGRVLKIFRPERKDNFFCLSVSLVHARCTQRLVRTSVVIL